MCLPSRPKGLSETVLAVVRLIKYKINFEREIKYIYLYIYVCLAVLFAMKFTFVFTLHLILCITSKDEYTL